MKPTPDDTPCNTSTECPWTPADQPGAVTPLFLGLLLIPVLLVCLLALLANLPYRKRATSESYVEGGV